VHNIEKVQRRFTKRLHGLKDLSYAERLQCLNIPSLELRRLHLDLLFCYKIMFGLVCVNPGVLRLRQHNIGYTADGFYRSDDPTNSVKALKEGG